MAWGSALIEKAIKFTKGYSEIINGKAKGCLIIIGGIGSIMASGRKAPGMALGCSIIWKEESCIRANGRMGNQGMSALFQ